MNWIEYGPCTRCEAGAGKPCIHGRHHTPMNNPHPGRPLRTRATVSAATKTAPKPPPEDVPAEPGREPVTPGYYLWVQLRDRDDKIVHDDERVSIRPDDFPRVVRHDDRVFVYDDTSMVYRETSELVV